MYANKHFIAATSLIVTEARGISCSWTTPLVFSYQALFIKNPTSIYNYGAYIEPLTDLAWNVMIVYLMSLPIIIFIVVILSKEKPFIPLEECYGINYVAILHMGITQGPDTIPTKMVILW